jgi:hypothetical protein
MYSIGREELPSWKAREQVWRRIVARKGLPAAMDRPVCEREGEERKREEIEVEERVTRFNFPQSHQPDWHY